MAYFASFHSILKTWHNLLGKFNQYMSCIYITKENNYYYSCVWANSSCRNLFNKLEVLAVSCNYILSLMMSVVKNQTAFQTYLHMDWKPGTWIDLICLLAIFHVFRQFLRLYLYYFCIVYMYYYCVVYYLVYCTLRLVSYPSVVWQVFWFRKQICIYVCFGLHVKYPLLLSDFNVTWILLTKFRKMLLYQI